jgi:hypothetical protein
MIRLKLLVVGLRGGALNRGPVPFLIKGINREIF